MKALVVYESMFGNTETIARAVADGLAPTMQVELRAVSHAAPGVPHDVDLIVLGAPTHAFTLSRPSTRMEALRQGATEGEEAVGMREWLAAAKPHGSIVAATFDTRAAKVRHLPGSAARKVARILGQRGFGRIVARESFYVTDVSGPLLSGETARARLWAASLPGRMPIDASRPAVG
jgi:hypothetical protein